MSKKMHIADIYASQMDELQLGHALWCPEGDDLASDIEIGDVGYIREGVFIRMFNMKYAADHKSHLREKDLVPPNHKPFEDRLGERPHATNIASGILKSRGVKFNKIDATGGGQLPGGAGASACYELSLAEAQGACLYIPHDARQEKISRTKNVTDYMKANWKAWNHHALHDVGLDMPSDGPILVHGHKKTVEWTVAAARSSSSEHHVGIEAGSAVHGNVRLNWAQSSQAETSVQSRSGPRDRIRARTPLLDASIDLDAHVHSHATGAHSTGSQLTVADGVRYDQCIFLQYYKVKRRFLFLKFVAAAGPARLPPPSPEGEEQAVTVDAPMLDVETNTPASSFCSTLDVLLDYLLQNSEAELAIACHDEIDSLLTGIRPPHDFAQFLDITRPQIVSDAAVATLDLVDLIKKERIQRIKTHGQPLLDADEGVNIPDTADKPEETDGSSCDGYSGLAYSDLALTGSNPDGPILKWPHLLFRGKTPHSNFAGSAPMALSADGTKVAAGFDDFSTMLWDAKNGELIEVLEAHTDEVWSVSFSPDGNRLVTCSVDGTAMVWEAIQGHTYPVLVLSDHGEHVVAAVYSPNGSCIATGSTDCLVKLWDAVLGHCLSTLSGHISPLSGLIFTPDSKRLISYADDVAKVWDLNSATEIATLKGHTDMIWSVALSHNVDRVATASEDGTCRIWDLESGDELVIIADHQSPVSAVVWSPYDTAVATSSADCTVRLSDSFSGELFHVLEHGTARVDSVDWSPDGRLICSGGNDGRVRLWNSKTGNIVASLGETNSKAGVTNVKFTSDSQDVFFTSSDSAVRAWNVSDTVRLC